MAARTIDGKKGRNGHNKNKKRKHSNSEKSGDAEETIHWFLVLRAYPNQCVTEYIITFCPIWIALTSLTPRAYGDWLISQPPESPSGL